MKKILAQVKRTIVQHQLIESGDKVLVSCSGGADSVFLFYVLFELKDELQFDLTVAHLNHSLRGEESDRDLEFVKSLAYSHNIPFISDIVEVKSHAKKNKLSLEEAGRELRYEFLFHAAYKIGASRVALGHHLDDKVETFMLRLIRGAGVQGLCSISHIREENDIYFIRPLLDLKKEEIECFLKEKKIAFRLDASNKDERFLRNKIRNQLLPLLEEEYNNGVCKNILKTIDSLSLFNDFVKRQIIDDFNEVVEYADEKFIIPLSKLERKPVYLQREIIKKLLYQLYSDVKFQHVNDLLHLAFNLNTGAKLDLDKRTIAFKEYGKIVVCFREVIDLGNGFMEDLTIPGETVLAKQKLRITSSYEDKSPVPFERKSVFADLWEQKTAHFIAYFDADKIGDTYVTVRSRRNGDKIKPIAALFSKKVKNIFINHKVPKWFRGNIPIFCIDNEIIWITGYRIAEKYKVTEKTKQVLKIVVEKIVENI